MLEYKISSKSSLEISHSPSHWRSEGAILVRPDGD